MTHGDDLVPCVGGLVYSPDGALLLVRRANQPGRGRWSIPGGRVEPGEDDHSAVVRELAEETGLTVEPDRLIGRVTRGRYVIGDYACRVVGGTLAAGDDALDARWCTAADLASLPLVDGLLDALTEWGALPGSCAASGAGAPLAAHGWRQPPRSGSGRAGCSPPRASP